MWYSNNTLTVDLNDTMSDPHTASLSYAAPQQATDLSQRTVNTHLTSLLLCVQLVVVVVLVVVVLEVVVVVVVVVVEIFVHGTVKATVTNAPQSQLNK